MTEVGKLRRMRRLGLGSGRRVLWLPVDDALISGPDGHLGDPRRVLYTPQVLGHVDAVLGFGAGLSRCARLLADMPLVFNLSASTVGAHHLRKVRVGGVEQAVAAGADGVAVHVNFTSDHEPEQLQVLADVVGEAGRWGMPVVVIAYPRNENTGGRTFYEVARDELPDQFAMVAAHVVRVAVELGADVVKTMYTGSPGTFAGVVDAALGVPVLIAGEALDPDGRRALEWAGGAVAAGGAGVAYGRQIFARDAPGGFVPALRAVLDG